MIYKYLDKLKGTIPASILLKIAENPVIDGPLRLCHLLSQCAHESMNFKRTEENLNYSSFGLKNVFGKYFISDELEDFVYKPQKIANRVYANRNGNGDESSGDGWLYHGRGYIQLTGRDNYQEFSLFCGEDCVSNPDLVSKKYPLESAIFYFTTNDLWRICDKGSDIATIKRITKAVNGGYNGLDDRIKLFNQYHKLCTR